jgi:hypothetical protein
VTRLEELVPAVERALAAATAGRPACVNIMVESIAAPLIRAGA